MYVWFCVTYYQIIYTVVRKKLFKSNWILFLQYPMISKFTYDVFELTSNGLYIYIYIYIFIRHSWRQYYDTVDNFLEVKPRVIFKSNYISMLRKVRMCGLDRLE